MKKIRIALLSLAALIMVALFSYAGYRIYLKLGRPAESPFNAIPDNTALIIKLNKAGILWEDINRTNLLWKELTHFPGVGTLRDEILVMDSARKKNATINDILRQQNLLIAITMSGRMTFGALYLTTLQGPDPESSILEFVKEFASPKSSIIETPYAETKIHRIQLQEDKDPFYFAVLKGVFMGSFRSDLVKRAIDRLSLNSPSFTSAGFRRVESTTGKKVDANIYVNYRIFSLILSKVTRDEYLPSLLRVAKFADWSGLDLIIKKDELMLNGFTVAPDSNLHFLSLFSDQNPQKIEITSVIPASASYFTFYGWQLPSEYMQRILDRTLRNDRWTADNPAISSFLENHPVDLTKFFTPWIGNQACTFVVENGGSLQNAMTFAAFRTNDTTETRRALLSLSDTLGMKVDSTVFKGRKIFGLNTPSFFPALFGELFGRTTTAYCLFLEDYVIFGPDRKSLGYLVDEYVTGNTLAKSSDYGDFSGDIPDKANIYCYFSTKNSLQTIRGLLNDDLNSKLLPLMDSLKKFESVAFQFNNQEGIFYSSFFLRFNPNQNQEGPLQWKVALDTTVQGSPQIINDPAGNFVAVSDISNNVYLIDSEGRIRWKIPVMGKVLGKIHPVRIKPRDSLYLLFNTDTHLYMIRSDGEYADRFPMRFPARATNGITLLDYFKTKDYRILLALQDNHVYNFTLRGLSVPDWERPGLSEEILQPVRHLNTGRSDLLIMEGSQGNILITDRTGKQKIRLSPRFRHSVNSGFFVNRSLKKGVLVTSDPDGKVLFIQENGKTTEVTLNLFSPAHHFFYEDINRNGSPEFIFFDKNNLYYYNKSYKLIYSYGFRREILSSPFVVRAPGRKVFFGMVAPETSELYLFDQNGFRELGPGIRGNTPFEIGYVAPEEMMNLVVGSGKFVKNYRLAKYEK
jgi:hypothetical protein